ncbi:hypothetical protein D3P08_19470 [Paenibacillus nanensis]|uniref:Uncharacterized protein n=1 Tax=Paenibacillus nanensis TaxID=393251 RepID=A0A3A1UX21_9BACL|nr:general stress protein [Paenibacillus nanensis]RIX50873.1 hypothetical protein D3P08_19470 [Paenibacillus nanensis]
MAKKIAFFENEQKAITAINELEKAGFTPGEMKILAKNSEHSRRIERETDVHADELKELQETNEHVQDPEPVSFAVSSGSGFPVVTGSYGFGASGVSFATPFTYLKSGHESVYEALGLDAKETELCSQAIMEGAIAVIVETSESKALFDAEGGPDMSKLGIAEAAFRRSGAYRIVNGS